MNQQKRRYLSCKPYTKQLCMQTDNYGLLINMCGSVANVPGCLLVQPILLYHVQCYSITLGISVSYM